MATYTVDTDNSSGDYASLEAAMNGIGTLTEDTIIECQATGGAADTTACTIDITRDGFALLIRAASGQEAVKDEWDTAIYRLSVTDAYALTFDAGVTVEHLQIESVYSAVATQNALYGDSTLGAGTVVIDSCYVRATGATSYTGLYFNGASSATVTLQNCIFDCDGACIYFRNSNALKIYNCIVHGASNNNQVLSRDNSVTIRNTAFTVDTSAVAFYHIGTGTDTCEYCLSGDDLNTQFSTTTNDDALDGDWDKEFVDVASGDFTLVTGGNAAGGGIGPGSDANVPTTDMEGDTRSGTTCDAGVDESAGTTHELSGSSDSVSLLSATLDRELKLAGSADSVSLLSGVVTRDIKLAGSADSVSLLTAALTRNISMAGSVDSISLLSGGITRNIKLAGSSDSVSLLQGTINRALKLSGSVDSVSLLSGTLNVKLQLSGSADSISLLSGTLTTVAVVHQLSGSIDSVSATAAALRVLQSLRGSVDSVSETDGTLTVKLQLVGSTDSISLLSGALGLDIKLSGSADSISLLSGTLTDVGDIATGFIYVTVTPRHLSVMSTSKRLSITAITKT